MSKTENEALIGDLSASDKDELILRLWRDLQNERAHIKALEQQLAQLESTGTTKSPLLKKLQAASVGDDRDTPTAIARGRRLGNWRNVFGSTFLFALAGVGAIAFAADYAIGKYQSYRIDQSRLAELQLQHAAFEGLFVELVKVDYEPDEKSYRVTMKMTNSEPDRPVYVMQTPWRVFEQSGLAWKEVPVAVGERRDGQRRQALRLPHL